MVVDIRLKGNSCYVFLYIIMKFNVLLILIIYMFYDLEYFCEIRNWIIRFIWIYRLGEVNSVRFFLFCRLYLC